MTKKQIAIHKRYLIINSEIPFYIICNENMDRLYKYAGAWQIDLYKLLTKEVSPQYPIYTLFIEYDENLLTDNKKIEWEESDLDFGQSINNVQGLQVVIQGGLDDVAKENTLIELKNKDFATETTVDYINSKVQNILNRLNSNIIDVSTVGGNSYYKIPFFFYGWYRIDLHNYHSYYFSNNILIVVDVVNDVETITKYSDVICAIILNNNNTKVNEALFLNDTLNLSLPFSQYAYTRYYVKF